MKAPSLDIDTPLIPELIAEQITDSQGFINYASEKARQCYRFNTGFRKKLNGSASRDYLLMFMCHWYEGWKQTH